MKNKVITKLLASFITVLLLVGTVVYISSTSVKRVSSKADQLIKFEIPQLNEISNTQSLMAEISNNLFQYYATLDRDNHVKNIQNIERIKEDIKNITFINKQGNVNQLLDDSLLAFISYANKLDTEMQLGDGRDWDKLREYLYAAQENSKTMMYQLDTAKIEIENSVKQNSLSTQQEVNKLNYLQLGFSLAVLIAALFILVNLHFRIKDKSALFKRAYFNDISDLPNRKYFEENLEKILSNKTNNNFGFMLVNLDRFSLITGSMGYIFGDLLIKKISEWLVNRLKSNGDPFEIYHFSGTSWLVIFTNIQDKKHMINIANSILSMSTVSLNLGDREMTCSCSIGICFKPDNQIRSEELLSNLDTSLRNSKKSGGNTFTFYDPSMSVEAKSWIDTEQSLRNAIEKREFELFYQPKVDAQTGKVSSSEALLRWSKNGTLISPAVFIPIAEKSNLILKIGDWVLIEACKQWVNWQKEGMPAMPIAINISAQQFQEADFPSKVQDAIYKTGIPADMLELEITEEAAAHDSKHVVQIMNELKKIGVSLAIDDFGTGFSSLSHLSHFPVNVLKIDRAFIKNMNSSATDESIVKLILQLAKVLHFKVVAEGVETEMQYQQLKAWECDLIQGFLFSKPLPANQFVNLVMQEQQTTLINAA